jgi:hypothetical protein
MARRKQESFPFAVRGVARELDGILARPGVPTQLPLTVLAGPPARHQVTGIDPAKDTLHCAYIVGDGVSGVIDLLRRVHFVAIPWCTGIGWEQAMCLYGGQPTGWGGGHEWDTDSGYALCEAQWAGDDAKEKWSGLEALCQTAGALRASAVAAGLGLSGVTHWSRSASYRTPLPPPVRGLPAVYSLRGLGFIEPSAWRSVSLSPRPISPREVVRPVEAKCARAFHGRVVGADFAAAFGILLCALGLNYTDIGVPI